MSLPRARARARPQPSSCTRGLEQAARCYLAPLLDQELAAWRAGRQRAEWPARAPCFSPLGSQSACDVCVSASCLVRAPLFPAKFPARLPVRFVSFFLAHGGWVSAHLSRRVWSGVACPVRTPDLSVPACQTGDRIRRASIGRTRWQLRLHFMLLETGVCQAWSLSGEGLVWELA